MFNLFATRSRIAAACAVVFMIVLMAVPLHGQNPAAGASHLILYAFPAEGRLLAQKMTIEKTDTILGRPVHLGKLADEEVILAESGIGMNNAAMTTQKLIDIYHPRMVIFSGIAGAIDTGVHIGDIVVCRTWSNCDFGYVGKDSFRVDDMPTYNGYRDSIMEMPYFTADSMLFALAKETAISNPAFEKIGDRLPRVLVGGSGVSGNAFIDSRDKRLWLAETFHALVVDMESAAVAQVCTANGTPFIIFRSASDLAGGSGSETARSELDQFFQVAADNSSRVVMEFLSAL